MAHEFQSSVMLYDSSELCTIIEEYVRKILVAYINLAVCNIRYILFDLLIVKDVCAFSAGIFHN